MDFFINSVVSLKVSEQRHDIIIAGFRMTAVGATGR